LQTLEGFPIFDLQFNPDDEVYWAIPDAKIIEPQQMEANETRTQIMLHRRLAVIKLLYEAGAIDQPELDKLLNEEPVTAVKVNDIAKVTLAQAATIPKELLTHIGLVAQDIREETGFSRNQIGDLGQKRPERTTATEASIVQMASEIRIDERQDLVGDMLHSLVKAMHEVIFQFWQEEQVVDIVGPGGVPLWVEFSGKMLSGGAYEVHVDAESATPQSRQTREAKALQVYQILKDNPLIDPIKLTKNTLREMYGVQFDDMMRGLPPTAGLTRPMDIGQLAQLMGNAQRMGMQQPSQETAQKARKKDAGSS
jgi:hypothetical protein